MQTRLGARAANGSPGEHCFSAHFPVPISLAPCIVACLGRSYVQKHLNYNPGHSFLALDHENKDNEEASALPPTLTSESRLQVPHTCSLYLSPSHNLFHMHM